MNISFKTLAVLLYMFLILIQLPGLIDSIPLSYLSVGFIGGLVYSTVLHE